MFCLNEWRGLQTNSQLDSKYSSVRLLAIALIAMYMRIRSYFIRNEMGFNTKL